MQGKRVYADAEGDLFAHKFAPGEFGYDPFAQIWYCMSPNGHLGNLGNHTVTEHEDGTITVTPSILINHGPNNPVYHGYIERGVWRES